MQISDSSLDGIISGILGVFSARFEKKQKTELIAGKSKKNSDRNSAILEPFSRILMGYANTEIKNGRVTITACNDDWRS